MKRPPLDQQLEHVAAYVAKFLVGDTDAETAVLHTDGRFADPTAEWIDWETPELR